MAKNIEEVEDKNQNEELEVMLEQLQDVIIQLEGENISLEKSFVLYNQGMETIKKCNDSISVIEKKVQVIDQNGAMHDF